MGNKGSITVFCSLMIIVMLFLGISGIKVVEHHMAKSKGAMAVKSAMSGVDAGYNSYIFENYHILLFDKNCGGKGEACLEEQLVRDIQINLGERFEVKQIGVSEYRLLMEEDCAAFKEQMADYCGYAMVEYGADKILNSTGGGDGTVGNDIYEDMDAAQESASQGNGADASEDDEAVAESTGEVREDPKDPREFTDKLSANGILAIVAPEALSISSEKVDISSVPSTHGTVAVEASYDIDKSFQDMDILKSDIDEYDSWKEKLIDGGVGLGYGASVFNCATEEVLKDTVFSFELEYIICGNSSDEANLKGVVNRIIGLRFPVNYAYLVTDAGKMGEVSKISVPLAITTGVPEPILKYLMAGCWAYVEAISDTRCLLHGERIGFLKDDKSWKTDLNNLEDSVNSMGKESDTGMCYKDYLLILMAMDMEDGYYRMLDIIELNTRQHYKDFRISNAAVGFWMDAQINYQGKDYYYSESMGY